MGFWNELRERELGISTNLDVEARGLCWVDVRPCGTRRVSSASGFNGTACCIDVIDTQVGDLALVGGRGNDGCLLHLYEVPSSYVTPPVPRFGERRTNGGSPPLATRRDDMTPSTGAITCVKWFPADPSLFVVGTSMGLLETWDAETFTCVQHIKMINDTADDPIAPGVRAICVPRSPDSTAPLVAVASTSSQLIVVDLRANAVAYSISGHSQRLLDVSWSPVNAHLVATGSWDRTARLFDIRRAGPAACLTVLDKDNWLRPPRMMPQMDVAPSVHSRRPEPRATPGGLIVPGSSLSALSGPSWGARRIRKIHRLESAQLALARQPHRVECVRFTPDGGRLVTNSTNSPMYHVWETFTGQRIMQIRASTLPERFEISGDSSMLIAREKYHGLTYFDLETGAKLDAHRNLNIPRVVDLAVHPGKEEIYTTDEQGVVDTWCAGRDFLIGQQEEDARPR